MAINDCCGCFARPTFHAYRENKRGGAENPAEDPAISLCISLIILVGVILIQIPHAQSVDIRTLWLGIIPVIIAAFAYPLGNRKMMELLSGRLDTFQRVLGMTLMTLPIWIGIAIYALWTVGPPVL